MPDIPKIPETAPGPPPDATPGTPTEVAQASLAPASQPEPSVADTARLQRFAELAAAAIANAESQRALHEQAAEQTALRRGATAGGAPRGAGGGFLPGGRGGAAPPRGAPGGRGRSAASSRPWSRRSRSSSAS